MATSVNTIGSSEKSETAVEPVYFNYVGTSATGRNWAGYIEAEDESQAEALLKSANLTVDRIWPKVVSAGRAKKVKRKDLAVLAGGLADLVQSGLTMPSAILAIAKTASNKTLKEALGDVSDAFNNNLTAGSDAFKVRDDIFTVSFINHVKVGEITGDIPTILREYSAGELMTDETVSKLKNALIYPVTVLAAASLIIVAILYFVVPKLKALYEGLAGVSKKAQLPLPTRILTAASDFLISWPGVIACAVIILGIFALCRWASGPGNETLQRKALNWPLVGPFLLLFNSAYTARSLSSLIRASQGIHEPLDGAVQSSLNIVYREMLEEVREACFGGKQLSVAFLPYAALMGDEFRGACSTGELSGAVEGRLKQYADLKEKHLRAKLDAITKPLEVIMIVILGIVIGGIVVASYLPLFSLIVELSKH